MPRPVTSVTDLAMTVNFALLFLFSPALISPLATPSALTRHCLAAARSRRGSDMPLACHSLPRRRFATLKGAALRGKDLGQVRWLLRALGAPLRGAGGVSRLRGRQCAEIADREKRGQCVEYLCHSEERSDVGIRIPSMPRGNILLSKKRNGLPQPVCELASQ